KGLWLFDLFCFYFIFVFISFLLVTGKVGMLFEGLELKLPCKTDSKFQLRFLSGHLSWEPSVAASLLEVQQESKLWSYGAMELHDCPRIERVACHRSLGN